MQLMLVRRNCFVDENFSFTDARKSAFNDDFRTEDSPFQICFDKVNDLMYIQNKAFKVSNHHDPRWWKYEEISWYANHGLQYGHKKTFPVSDHLRPDYNQLLTLFLKFFINYQSAISECPLAKVNNCITGIKVQNVKTTQVFCAPGQFSKCFFSWQFFYSQKTAQVDATYQQLFQAMWSGRPKTCRPLFSVGKRRFRLAQINNMIYIQRKNSPNSISVCR